RAPPGRAAPAACGAPPAGPLTDRPEPRCPAAPSLRTVPRPGSASTEHVSHRPAAPPHSATPSRLHEGVIPMTSSKELNPLYGKTVELDPSISVAVVGAAGKMGTRVSNNLNLTDAPIHYVEASEAGQARLKELGREVSS